MKRRRSTGIEMAPVLVVCHGWRWGVAMNSCSQCGFRGSRTSRMFEWSICSQGRAGVDNGGCIVTLKRAAIRELGARAISAFAIILVVTVLASETFSFLS